MKCKMLVRSCFVVAFSVLAFSSVEAASYEVQKGDTLTKIAKANRVSIEQLKEWNNLNDDKILVDQKLVVANLSSSAKNQSKQVQSEVKSQVHKVQKGDTLTSIAKRYQVSVAQLKGWNRLKEDQILIGQSLNVQSAQVQEALEIVQVEQQSIINVKPTDGQIETQLKQEREIKAQPSTNSLELYKNVVEMAKQQIGVPYKFGGSTPEGFDCSGFIHYVHNIANVGFPRKSSANYFFQDTTVVQQPVPGDLVFFKDTYISGISHMGIYIGNNEFIHAGASKVEISKLSYRYWSDRFVAFKRLHVMR